MWKLFIDDDQAQRSVVPLSRADYRIGRARDNHVRLTERNVSRQHARLRCTEDGEWRLEDLRSYNGVFVNGTRMAGLCSLKSGDTVQLGDFTLRLQENEMALSNDTEPPAVDRLVLVSGPRAGSEFPVGATTQLGSAPGCSTHLPYPGVLKHHATLQRLEDGRYELIDHAGDGSTQVNGVAGARALLGTGDEALIGQARLRLVAAGERLASASPRPQSPASPAVTGATADAPPHEITPLTPSAEAVDSAPPSVVADPAHRASAKTSGGGKWWLAALALSGGIAIALWSASGDDPPKLATGEVDAVPALAKTPTLDLEREPPSDAEDADGDSGVPAPPVPVPEPQAAAPGANPASKPQPESPGSTASATQPRAAVALVSSQAQAKPKARQAKPAPRPKRRSRPSRAKKRKSDASLSGGIQRDNPFKSSQAAGTRGSESQMKQARRRLLGKVDAGKATPADLRALRDVCGELKDFACRTRASTLLRDPQAKP